MKILVTGAGGMVGSHMVEHLRNRGGGSKFLGHIISRQQTLTKFRLILNL